jgi:glycosyltransferase involved in cell wall biosynthesis
MRHAPNADGARWYLEHVHALVRQRVPSVELAIVGSDPPATLLAHRSVAIEVTGRVDDIRPWFARASVAIVPLLSGSGTRLKILEAMAAGVPVVSTSIGAEGLELEPESDILLADAPNEFADAVVRVLTDRDLALRLSARGQSISARRFDWTVVTRSLVEAHVLATERFEAAR